MYSKVSICALVVRLLLVGSILALLASIVVVDASPAAMPGDEDWTPGFHPAGVSGEILRMIDWDGRVVIAGSFTAVKDVVAGNVAALSFASAPQPVVTACEPLADGLDGAVRALCVFDGDLIAAGSFTRSGGSVVGNVARFDGVAWSAMGDGVPGTPAAAITYQGRLHVGRYRWDGVGWEEIFPCDGAIGEMVIQDGLLYVGGSFAEVRGQAHRNVFAWDGQAVIPLGDGLPSAVRAATAAPGGPMFAEGTAIHSWNGASWTVEHDRFLTNGLACDGASVYATGTWIIYAPYIYEDLLIVRRDGVWEAIDSVRARALHAREANLLVGAVGGSRPWPDPSPGLYGVAAGGPYEVFALSGYDSGFRVLAPFSSTVVAGGDFALAGGVPARGCAILADSGWIPWDEREDPSIQGDVSFEQLAVAGWQVYGVLSRFEVDIVVREPVRLVWSGDAYTWRSFGSCADLWNGGLLQAVGEEMFSVTGHSLQLLGESGTVTEIPGTSFDGWIQDCCAWQGDLVACGGFAANGAEPLGNVARWDGVAWTGVGGGVPSGRVELIAPLDGERLAAVSWDLDRGQRVWIFDGQDWQEVAGGFDGAIRALAWHRDRLFVAGDFDRVDAVWAPGIAVWTGERWVNVGSGLGGRSHGRVTDMVSVAERLYVAGEFRLAGGRPVAGFAQWTGDPALLTGAPSGVADGLPRREQWLAASPNPFNPSTVVHCAVPVGTWATIAVHDVRGRLVRRLAAAEFAPGLHEIVWNGRTDAGTDAPSGVYFVRFAGTDHRESLKIALLR